MRIKQLEESGHMGSMQNQQQIAPTELKQRAKDLQVAQRDPSAQVSIPTELGKSMAVDLEGVIEDPDDPNNMQIAVAGEEDGELNIFNLADAELLEDIARLSGVQNEDGKNI